MGKKKETVFMVGDFETTVYEGQENTEVWASALVELYKEDVIIHNSIVDCFNYLLKQDKNFVIYYHNLKFDGSFWLSYLLNELKYEQALDEDVFEDKKRMKNKTFTYMVTYTGIWYKMLIRTETGNFIELRDSLKLLPLTVKKIGKDFGTKHKKLDMEYTGYRYAGCNITDEEKQYIANDVLVVKEALEIMFSEGHDKLTIGSCCLNEYKKIIGGNYKYRNYFPDLTEFIIDEDETAKLQKLAPGDYTCQDADTWIRKAYRGGWCYLTKENANKVFNEMGTTADVNSLYPSMMHSMSGNAYPIGEPKFWKGNFIPNYIIGREDIYWFIKFKCHFNIKKGYLPFVQIKGTQAYKPNDMLETSDILMADGNYYRYWKDENGEIHDTTVELTMTMTDFILFKEHYDVEDLEIIEGCWFYSMAGLFDDYINKYSEIKKNSKGAKRQIAKLFLNNLYGKLASSKDSSYKIAYLKEDGSLGYRVVYANDKEAGHIACGAAITSYARNFTIRAAQANYHPETGRGFIYADTDSIHCNLTPEEIVGIEVHPTNFCCWALESCWDEAIFVRQKTYIEHATHEDLEPLEAPFYDVKCAGMPKKCKDLFVESLKDKPNTNELTKIEKDFVSKKRTLSDFKIGLKVPGKLMPTNIPGGILLKDGYYEMRPIMFK